MVGRVFWRRVLTLAAAAVLFSSVVACAASAAAPEGEWAVLIRHFRTKAQIAPASSVRVVRVEESALGEGTRAGVLQVGEGPAAKETAFVASPDGRFVVFGAVEDVTLDPAAAVMAKIQLDGEVFRGPADAPITVVEYSDFQCPFCAKGYRIIEEEVLPAYEGKIRFFYKHLPLPFHSWAEPAAIAMECVKLQSPAASWRVYEALFEKQRQIRLDNVSDKVFALADDAALVRATFDACVVGKDTLGRVRAQAAEAASIGLSGTPSFVINGRIIKGAQPPARFRAILDDELQID
ncbi:MAG: thioredoxin domain-containing protein [Deltaproteobacteria bacterium]